jgi:hypothetical protein
LKDEDVVVPSRVTAACQKVQSEFLFASPIDVESSRPTPASRSPYQRRAR